MLAANVSQKVRLVSAEFDCHLEFSTLSLSNFDDLLLILYWISAKAQRQFKKKTKVAAL